MDAVSLGIVGVAVLAVIVCMYIVKAATRETSFEEVSAHKSDRICLGLRKIRPEASER